MVDNSVKNFFNVLILGVVILLGLVIFAVAIDVKEDFKRPGKEIVINSFEECAAAGNPVMESYPRQCRTESGQHFVEEVEDMFTN